MNPSPEVHLVSALGAEGAFEHFGMVAAGMIGLVALITLIAWMLFRDTNNSLR